MPEHRRGLLSSFLEDIQSKGRLSFSEAELPQLRSEKAVVQALVRQQAMGKVRRILRKPAFFVIVPPEFRQQGVPPIDWWLDDLMKHLGVPYYVGLLTAAQWHGSSHFPVMETQVVVPTNRDPITAERTVIRFFASAHVQETPVETRTNMWASVRVGTPAATLVDLAEHRHFGADRLVMVTNDLLSKLTAADITAALNAGAHIQTAQRLGFLLERAHAPALADTVEQWIGRKRARTIGLDPSAPLTSHVARRWKVSINTNLEAVA
jgi:hypothetical protein